MNTALRATSESVGELDRLGDEIAELSAHLDAATARLLDLIREFDARGGWNNGFSCCAAWLSWRVGLAPGAAREHVRVARALGTPPRLAQALARAELSYSKIRVLTRVATPETEERLLAVGRAGTTEHVERIIRGWRRVDRNAEAREAARQHAGRALHVYPDEDGAVTVRGRLTAEVGALLVQALAAAREAVYPKNVPAGTCAPGVPQETPVLNLLDLLAIEEEDRFCVVLRRRIVADELVEVDRPVVVRHRHTGPLRRWRRRVTPGAGGVVLLGVTFAEMGQCILSAQSACGMMSRTGADCQDTRARAGRGQESGWISFEALTALSVRHRRVSATTH